MARKNGRIDSGLSVFAAAVCTAALMAALGSCSGKGGASNSGGRAAAALRDLGGIDITIGNWWADYDTNTYRPENPEAERTLEYRKKIQQDYNFKMREKIIGGWGQMQEVASTSIMAGDPAADVFVLSGDWAMALYNVGLAYPVSDCTSVDLTRTDPVDWNQNVLKAFTFNGKSYGFAATGSSANGQGVYWNKRLLQEAGIDPNLPYDLQKAGTWTWDAFLDLLKRTTRDIDNDGIIDTYGMMAFNVDVLNSAVVSNGAMYIDKDPVSGKFTNATTKPEFVEALQFGIRLQKEGVLKPSPEGANWDYFATAFHDGMAAFRVAETYVSGSLQDMKDDWGFAAHPKGPRAADYKRFAGENVMIIPSTYSPEEADKILYAVSLWLTPAPGNDNPDEWKIASYNSYRDARAVDETLPIMREARYGVYPYQSVIPGLQFGPWMQWIMWDDGADPAQIIEAAQPPLQAVLDRINGIN